MNYILVTGACGGIGKVTVQNLLNDGFHVIGLDKKESDIINDHYSHIICDIIDDKSINETFNKVKDITSNLYAIINVAGIFKLQTLIEGSKDDLKEILEINFFGTYNINKAMFPILKEDSKILIFSSEVARYSPQPFDGYYALSKVLVDKYGDILRRELNYLKIKVIKVQSGAIKTDLLTGVNSKYEETLNQSKYYKKPLTKLKKLMDNEINKQVDPEIIGKKLLKIIKKKHPKILYKIKNSFKLRFLNCLPEKLQDLIYIKVIK